MIAQFNIIDVGVVSTCYVAVIGVYIFLSRTKVNHHTFNVHREDNQKEHDNIRSWIEDAEKRSEERHRELKADLKEVKQLIRNNGNSPPRIQI